MGDICDPSSIEHAFVGVNCVFHCAAYINFQYPPNLDELDRVNVNGNLFYFIMFTLSPSPRTAGLAPVNDCHDAANATHATHYCVC